MCYFVKEETPPFFNHKSNIFRVISKCWFLNVCMPFRKGKHVNKSTLLLVQFITRINIINNYNVLKPKFRGKGTSKLNSERQSLHTFNGLFQFAGHSIGTFIYIQSELIILALRFKIWKALFSCILYLFYHLVVFGQ